jgi:hypothetical protein
MLLDPAQFKELDVLVLAAASLAIVLAGKAAAPTSAGGAPGSGEPRYGSSSASPWRKQRRPSLRSRLGPTSVKNGIKSTPPDQLDGVH